jgi:hypothetical protein
VPGDVVDAGDDGGVDPDAAQDDPRVQQHDQGDRHSPCRVHPAQARRGAGAGGGRHDEKVTSPGTAGVLGG